MEDFKFMVRLLAAIQAQEGAAVFDTSYISESVLQTTAKKRDMLAYKLNKDGYIDGLFAIDDVDNQAYPHIMWTQSHPYVTIKGLAYMQECEPFRKAARELKELAGQSAAAVIANQINGML